MLTSIIIIATLALIIFASHFLNNKVADYKDSCTAQQSKCTEQAIIDETADEAVVVDVVDVADSAIKKVVIHTEPPVAVKKSKRGRKPSRKAQNNTKLSA